MKPCIKEVNHIGCLLNIVDFIVDFIILLGTKLDIVPLVTVVKTYCFKCNNWQYIERNLNADTVIEQS